MTPEEIAAKLAELEAKNIALEADSAAKIAELEAKVAPPVPDPDEKYKPASWKALDETVDQRAEAAALKVLQDAEKKKEDQKKKEDEDLADQTKKVEESFKKLEEEGLLLPTTTKDDAGGRQRAQILGSLVRSGGQYVETEARKLKTAWDNGMEYDFESNSFKRAGSAPSANRDMNIGSSANYVPATPQKGPIDTRAIGGDLDRAQELWESANGKA